MEELFKIVAEVELYKNFLPYCTTSVITSRNSPNFFTADLTIGISPFLEESFSSHITVKSPTQVKLVFVRGNLFNHMETILKFSPGINSGTKNCGLDLYMSFELRSLLHTQFLKIVLNEIADKMIVAFSAEAKRRYGPTSI